MLDWIKNINKEYPEFWKIYLSKFQKKSNRFVALSTETSGLSLEKDVILSIGCFSIINNSIIISDSFETFIGQYNFFQQKGITNEFTLETKMKKMGEPEAIQAFVDFIGNSVLVGHRIDFDVEIINVALERMGCGRLKNEALDIDVMHRKLLDINNKEFSLDELCTIYRVPLIDRNSFTEDAYKIALLFLKLKSRLGLN
ncbi:MAG TPA: DNA polymerase III subunit epsilon [Flavobacterium sp.]|nr:DNA polymerase III subunit epsilon [Flavobacterium sp.]HAT80390.1 DNA polymerase III subunit epsilon [Flavobacterium sp.]